MPDDIEPSKPPSSPVPLTPEQKDRVLTEAKRLFDLNPSVPPPTTPDQIALSKMA